MKLLIVILTTCLFLKTLLVNSNLFPYAIFNLLVFSWVIHKQCMPYLEHSPSLHATNVCQVGRWIWKRFMISTLHKMLVIKLHYWNNLSPEVNIVITKNKFSHSGFILRHISVYGSLFTCWIIILMQYAHFTIHTSLRELKIPIEICVRCFFGLLCTSLHSHFSAMLHVFKFCQLISTIEGMKNFP